MKYVFARATTSLSVPGQVWKFAVIENGAYWADHPAVVAHPSSFSPDPIVIHPHGWATVDVEQASASPGERRNARREERESRDES